MEYSIEKTGQTNELFVIGDLKFGDHGIVETITTLLDDASINTLVINLSKLAKLDSYGIGILLKANQLAEDRSKSMAVRGVSGNIAEIFTMFNLSEAITVLED